MTDVRPGLFPLYEDEAPGKSSPPLTFYQTQVTKGFMHTNSAIYLKCLEKIHMSTFLGWEPALQAVGVLAALLFGLYLNLRHRYGL